MFMSRANKAAKTFLPSQEILDNSKRFTLKMNNFTLPQEFEGSMTSGSSAIPILEMCKSTA